jgi:hypothetical protein
MEKLINFIEKITSKNKNFITYTLVGAVISLLNIILVWILIDFLHVHTLIATSGVVGFLFLFKFYLYKKTGFTT